MSSRIRSSWHSTTCFRTGSMMRTVSVTDVDGWTAKDSTMTFDEWLVIEHGCNHGWMFPEVDAAREAWEASAKNEREALEDRTNSLLEAMKEAQSLIRKCD